MKTQKYSLRRVSDNEGCAGKYSIAIEWNEDDSFKEEHRGPRPIVGCSMMVGMGLDYYWLTTIVTEILEDTPNMVRFKTLNSEYIWKIN